MEYQETLIENRSSGCLPDGLFANCKPADISTSLLTVLVDRCLYVAKITKAKISAQLRLLHSWLAHPSARDCHEVLLSVVSDTHAA